MPRRTATFAAPTVPDVPMAGPGFWPKLMPDTTRSGLTPSLSIATPTASAGVPATDVAGMPLIVVTDCVVTGPAVVLSATPLWFVAGATTAISTPGSLISAA